MLQHVPPDEGEEDDDYKYARTDAHRQPLPTERWTRTEIGVPLGMISVAMSILCLLIAVAAPFTFLFPVLSHLAQITEDRGPAAVKLPTWVQWAMTAMPWVSVAAALLGGYAYATRDETERKAGLSGATIGGVAFLVWAVVRALSRNFSLTSP